MRAKRVGLALGMLLGVSGAAYASQETLDIAFQQQGQPDWCWAAVTQMVGENYGSTISQCQAANAALHRSDCCKSPSSCSVEEVMEDQLDYWGFSSSKNQGQPTWATITNEIDRGRPIIVVWQNNVTGDHHATIVAGYRDTTGTREVQVLNPKANAAQWQALSTYLNNDTTTVIAYDTDVVWAPTCSTDFSQLPDTLYQKCPDQRIAHGQTPSALASSNGMMGGAFNGSASHPVAWNNSLADLSSFVDAHSDTMRPEMITVW